MPVRLQLVQSVLVLHARVAPILALFGRPGLQARSAIAAVLILADRPFGAIDVIGVEIAATTGLMFEVANDAGNGRFRITMLAPKVGCRFGLRFLAATLSRPDIVLASASADPTAFADSAEPTEAADASCALRGTTLPAESKGRAGEPASLVAGRFGAGHPEQVLIIINHAIIDALAAADSDCVDGVAGRAGAAAECFLDGELDRALYRAQRVGALGAVAAEGCAGPLGKTFLMEKPLAHTLQPGLILRHPAGRLLFLLGDLARVGFAARRGGAIFRLEVARAILLERLTALRLGRIGCSLIAEPQRVSIGAQSGPRIGIQEGPHLSTL